jgi:hypothetical protein
MIAGGRKFGNWPAEKGKRPADKDNRPAEKGKRPADKDNRPAEKGKRPADRATGQSRKAIDSPLRQQARRKRQTPRR